MKEILNFHGSDIEKISKHYAIPLESIINYSGNVNPLGLSPQLKSKLIDNIDLVTNYPDPDYITLKENISKYVSCYSEHVLLGNGTTELIAHYIDYINPSKSLIIGPTYSEYEKKINSIGGDIHYVPLLEENDFKFNIQQVIAACDESVELIVLCNPNNPTGTLVTKDEVSQLLDHCKTQNTYLLVDETYMDFVEDSSLMSSIGLVNIYNNLLVLRGFSKFFAAPGLRLGYGVTSDLTCHQHIDHQRHHWAINSLAAFAGGELMIDKDFIENSRTFIKSERQRILDLLSEIKEIKVFPNYSNFYFIKILDDNYKTKALFEFLIKQGLMIRDASSFPFLHGEYFRFCLKSQRENDKLIQALKGYFKD